MCLSASAWTSAGVSLSLHGLRMQVVGEVRDESMTVRFLCGYEHGTKNGLGMLGCCGVGIASPIDTLHFDLHITISATMTDPDQHYALHVLLVCL